MADFEFEGADLLKLAEDIGIDAQKVAEGAFPLVKQYVQELRDDWRQRAKRTAKRHGRLYPRTITAEQTGWHGGPEWEVGPESARRQGGMGKGFEYGSVHQPPHWDMTSAAVLIEPKFIAAADELARSFLP